MKRLIQLISRGLIALLPVSLTLYLIGSIAVGMESALGAVLRVLFPDLPYFPGIGFLFGILLAISAGVLINAWIGSYILAKIDLLLQKTPLVSTVLAAVKDMLKMFAGNSTGTMRQVVLVRLGEHISLVGLVTREDVAALVPGAGQDLVMVYLPMTYNVGGYTMAVPRHCLTPLPMSPEEAMRGAITGFVQHTPPTGVYPAGLTEKVVADSDSRRNTAGIAD